LYRNNKQTQEKNMGTPQEKVTISRLDAIHHRPWQRFGYRVFTRDEQNIEVFEGRYPSTMFNSEGIRAQLAEKYPAEGFRIESIPFPTIEDYNEGKVE
jgi:hypothetical protein